jgi:hypothetical protein
VLFLLSALKYLRSCLQVDASSHCPLTLTWSSVHYFASAMKVANVKILNIIKLFNFIFNY